MIIYPTFFFWPISVFGWQVGQPWWWGGKFKNSLLVMTFGHLQWKISGRYGRSVADLTDQWQIWQISGRSMVDLADQWQIWQTTADQWQITGRYGRSVADQWQIWQISGRSGISVADLADQWQIWQISGISGRSGRSAGNQRDCWPWGFLMALLILIISAAQGWFLFTAIHQTSPIPKE